MISILVPTVGGRSGKHGAGQCCLIGAFGGVSSGLRWWLAGDDLWWSGCVHQLGYFRDFLSRRRLIWWPCERLLQSLTYDLSKAEENGGTKAGPNSSFVFFFLLFKTLLYLWDT